jgi:hypothetical protein
MSFEMKQPEKKKKKLSEKYMKLKIVHPLTSRFHRHRARRTFDGDQKTRHPKAKQKVAN